MPDLEDTAKQRGPSPHAAEAEGGNMDRMASAAAADAVFFLEIERRSIFVRTMENGSRLCSMPLAKTASLRWKKRDEGRMDLGGRERRVCKSERLKANGG